MFTERRESMKNWKTRKQMYQEKEKGNWTARQLQCPFEICSQEPKVRPVSSQNFYSSEGMEWDNNWIESVLDLGTGVPLREEQGGHKEVNRARLWNL